MADFDANVLDQIGFTEKDITQATARDRLRDGGYGFVCESGKNKTNDTSGNMMTSIRLKPLEDLNDAASVVNPGIMHNIIHPLKNPDPAYKAHVAPKTIWIVHTAYHAFLPEEIPARPKKDAGRLVWEPSAEFVKKFQKDFQLHGKEVPGLKSLKLEPGELTTEEAKTLEPWIARLVMAKCIEHLRNENMLVGHACYAEVYTNKSSAGTFANLKNFTPLAEAVKNKMPFVKKGEFKISELDAK